MKKLLTGMLLFLFALSITAQQKDVVIVHTNDTHSQIESFNDKKLGTVGGILWRDAALKDIRNQNQNTILVDAGDFVQGTPYFNFFKGEVEVAMMNKLGYDVVTFGNHEFDNGIDLLAQMLKKAKFNIVSSNYEFPGHALDSIVKKYVVIEKDGVKIGFLGIGIQPEGLIDSKNFGGKYLDPVISMNKYSEELKKQGCDYIVVISHSGYYDNNNKGDEMLAQESIFVDLIIGGHTHTSLDGCIEVMSKSGKKVMITQAGSRGAKIGKVNISFDK